MTTSLINPLTAFGFVLISEQHYQDLVSGNQTKSDRIEELKLKVQFRDEHIDGLKGHLDSEQKSAKAQIKDIETASDRQKATIKQLQEQTGLLEPTNRINGEAIDQLNAELLGIQAKLLESRKELDAIKETYRKTLATNAELEIKLGDAIADLSTAEQKYNELTVQTTTARTSTKIAISNARRDVLIALGNLDAIA